MCEFLQQQINKLAARNRTQEFVHDHFAIQHPELYGVVGYVKLDVRAQKGKIIEQHVFVETSHGSFNEIIDAKTAWGASLFLAGTVTQCVSR